MAATIRPGEIHLWIARTDLSDPVVDALRETWATSSIGERFFAEPEAHAVRSASPHDAAPLFYAIWTAKESVVKAAGGGLSIELGSFVVQPSPDRFTPVQNLGGDPALDGWAVLALPRMHPGCSGAVAARGSEWKTVLRRFPAAGLEGSGPWM